MKKHVCACLLVGSFLLAQIPVAAAEPAPAETRGATEHASTPPPDSLAQQKGGFPVIAYWKDDFILSTPDEKFFMKIRGNLQLDVKYYPEDSKDPNTFDIRRARIDFQGGLYRWITYRVQVELADSPYLRNAWADFGFRPWLHLRAGQMKPPFSTSWWTEDNNVNFMERGAGTPVYPFFDRGFWLWGEVLKQAVTYNVSIWTGAGIELDTPRGDIDDSKDVVGRLFLQPFASMEGFFLQKLTLCGQGSYGGQSVPTKRFETGGYGAAIRDDRFWTWALALNNQGRGAATVSSRARWGAELHFIRGPFSLSSEYLVVSYDGIRAYDRKDGVLVMERDGTVQSVSTWVSCFLTGETKRVGNFGWRQPAPIHDFDPIRFQGWGAWELLARYTYTRTSDRLFDTEDYLGETYRILEGAPEVHEITAGINWTWNAMVRWQFNYVYLKGNGRGIATGNTGNPYGTASLPEAQMVGLRMIFKF